MKRTNHGTFGTTITPQAVMDILNWLDEKMLIHHVQKKVMDKYGGGKQTALRWVMYAQSVDILIKQGTPIKKAIKEVGKRA